MQNEVNQEIITANIQKNVITFCKSLPSHVEKWTSSLLEATKPVRAVVNYSEQLRHVERANIKYLEGYKELQEKLLFKICSEVEDELDLIKAIVYRLNLTNQDVKNKLSLLEKTTLELDWEKEETPLLQGTAFQPPLSKILEEGYQFVIYFCNAYKSISESLKVLNLRNEETMKDFENKFQLDLRINVVTGFLAIVQYVHNDKAIK